MQYFDAIVTTDEVQTPKPAPDIFLLAAKKIGCDPTKCRLHFSVSLFNFSIFIVSIHV